MAMQLQTTTSCLGITILLSGFIVNNLIVNDVYMDEEFHYRQTKSYCEGKYYEWDSKITTLPGLYFIAVLFAKASSHLYLSSYCSLSSLRFLSMCFSLGNLVLICRIRQRHELIHALVIWSLPIHLFISMMYYTDTAAIFFVLLMYSLALQSRSERLQHGSSIVTSSLSALVGAVAVLIRQTNIIWVLFVVGIEIVHDIELRHSKFIYKNDSSIPIVLARFLQLLIKDTARIISIFWSYLVVVVGFIVFVWRNEGIVVGDKSNHQASIHLAQLAYMGVVVASGFGVQLIPRLIPFAIWCRQNAVRTVVIATLVALAVHFTSITHPFLLADNRHYTFYIWKNWFLKYEWAAMTSVPLYCYCFWVIWSELRKVQTVLWLVVFTLATALVLIPSPLVEPRYYLLPFIICHLNTPRQPTGSLVLTWMIYMLIHCLTLYLYFFKPFRSPDGTVGRFMW